MKFCANFGKSSTKTLAMIRQVFEDKSVSCMQVFEWHVQFRAVRKRGDR
jgi:hypothetical protein